VPVLSPLADSISQYLVFDPTVQTWFLAAKRGKRLLVDIGRVDLDVGRDARRGAAFNQAVKALSPLPIGTPVRIYDAWGAEDDTVIGFDNWKDRIVAVLGTSRHLDSLVHRASTTYAAVIRTDTTATTVDSLHPVSGKGDTGRLAARRVDSTQQPSKDSVARLVAAVKPGTDAPSTAPPVDPLQPPDALVAVDSCRHDTLSTELQARAAAVRDSIELWLEGLPPPPFPRLVASQRMQATQVTGCFGGANRAAIAVDLRAGANEWIRERAVLLDTLGRVTTLKVIDYRLKGHDFIAVLDPNGSGVDGIVARGLTELAGETVILTLQPGHRLSRLAGGFAWESR
jgi:hypothetical protein